MMSSVSGCTTRFAPSENAYRVSSCTSKSDLFEIHLTRLEELIAKIGIVEALRDEIEERLKRGESVVDVVRQSAGQDTQRRQPLRLSELAFEAALVVPQPLSFEGFPDDQRQIAG